LAKLYWLSIANPASVYGLQAEAHHLVLLWVSYSDDSSFFELNLRLPKNLYWYSSSLRNRKRNRQTVKNIAEFLTSPLNRPF
jgi:hypothetical protein